MERLKPRSKLEAKIPEKSGVPNVPEKRQEDQEVRVPIQEDESGITYLGVRLEKAKNQESPFVPSREQYKDFLNEPFSLELQKKIAISFLQGDPILVEGGTSIGKTTTVRKMCAELGYEVHYANVNGATDVEDLMGRYVPNPHKKRQEDPEYIFADGKVTSGLREEEGKIKVVIVDEINTAAPNILIRLHEVLDALERNGEVVLAEDASETVRVKKSHTKIIGLSNPPGKGFLERQPLDPAQLRRWVYQKEVTDLPKETQKDAIDALFFIESSPRPIPQEQYVTSRETPMAPEVLQEIPGIREILDQYKEFHNAAKEMVHQRKIGQDQPQSFTYDDRMEWRRVRDFITHFYRGDINETFQSALRYYYANKLESKEDKKKLEELIRHVVYVPPVESKRKGLKPKTKKTPEATRGKIESSLPEQLAIAQEILGERDVLGPDAIEATWGITIEDVPDIPFSREDMESAKELNQFLILRADKAPDGSPLTMKTMQKLLQEKLTHEKKGKVLYDTDWYQNESFYKEETPKLEWALVSKEIIPDSTSKNYHEQTDAIAKYLKNKVHNDREIREPYWEALHEWEEKKEELRRLINENWKEAARELSELKINTLTRQTPVESLYDILTYFKKNNTRILGNKYTWTKRLASDGLLVSVGYFDAEGAHVVRWRPVFRDDVLGVSFSRSF